MDSAGLRQRRPIPTFTVDLSVKPEDRYAHIVPHLLPHIRRAKLTDLFDDLITQFAPGHTVGSVVRRSAQLLLRRVYGDEENAELQGIAKAADLPMYLLVAFNVVLDLLLGCTSGGVRVEEPAASRSSAQTKWRSHIVHFRTLDWGMDPLRELVVELEYVRSPGGPVVATTVGYFGYVGVLTGVRKGLSMSLNFRPRHDDSSLRKRLDFRKHQLMVILGLRPSISSVLRRYLLNEPQECPPHKSRGQSEPGDATDADADAKERKKAGFDIKTVITELSASPSTSAYLIFCTPQSVFSIEKDNHTAFVRTSDSFLTTYNHDASDEGDPNALIYAARQLSASEPKATTGMEEIVEYSTDRKRVLDKIYRRCVKRRRQKLGRPGDAVGMNDVFDFLNDKDKWIINDETHYAVIMDPKKGQVLWKRAFEAVPAAESDVEEEGA
ncbi:hypothetical protein CONLIGDRAFT_656996 [Coniochaeta ligniaria NRRL 30616]|uniref:ceramidase n=1 Tax=Coniochaeta ligniaria NRRL 30616 TaxID=1408157 RepID=A0A1J7J8A4_9PEZI|nr:hypothetical protein CONLIGDRAFT_656996 [Coniochaeta ligniaria NRRL 30616]